MTSWLKQDCEKGAEKSAEGDCGKGDAKRRAEDIGLCGTKESLTSGGVISRTPQQEKKR